METKDIIKGIKRIKDRTETQRGDVQTIGLACIEQVQLHRNPTYLGNLYNALGKGDKDAFARWALRFAGVKANLKKENKATLPFVVADTTPDAEGAAATPWYSYQKEATDVVRLQDESKVVRGMIARLKQGAGFKDAQKATHLAELLEKALAEAV